MPNKSSLRSQFGLPKSPTGIEGLDAITGGGLPRGRPTLVTGAAGSGKTLFAMEFLVHGAVKYGEPGLFVSFEETTEELIKNVLSLGFDIKSLIAQKKLAFEHIHIDRNEIEETGEYDLEGLFVRLRYAIDTIGARRIAIDTIETLFGGLGNSSTLRSELRRLFRWLKDRKLTAVVTAERGDGQLTRHGLEEYVSDAVIVLDHRVHDQLSTRRLRVVKYRGSAHGTNEYPFLLDDKGFHILPITSLELEHIASTERISSGIPALDSMLSSGGYYRGSSVLVSGTAGTGKSSIAAQFVDAACARGEKCLYFALEESQSQIIRNMFSIGIDLERWLKKGLLRFKVARPTLYGLEMHLSIMHKAIEEFKPSIVVIDPVTDLVAIGTPSEVKAMLARIIDFMKIEQITSLMTSLTNGKEDQVEQSEVGISSLIDTWLLVRVLEHNGERNRALYILKSRGMAHSNQVREFILTGHGVKLVDISIGPSGILVGSARLLQQAQDRASAMEKQESIERRTRDLARKRSLVEAQIQAMRGELETEEEEIKHSLESKETQAREEKQARVDIARLREAQQPGNAKRGRAKNGNQNAKKN